MALKDIVKEWFKTGLKPTQAQFYSKFDFLRWKDEKIPIADIDQIESILDAKAEAAVVTNHLTSATAHATEFDAKEDKANKGEVNGYVPLNEFALIAAQFLNIVNDVVTGGSDALLSAEQGKVLQEKINAINVLLTSDDVNLDTVQELVDAIKEVETSLESILVNDLTTGGVTKALTAEMGKSLKGLIDALGTDKVDKVAGERLINAAEIAKLFSIEAGAQVNADISGKEDKISQNILSFNALGGLGNDNINSSIVLIGDSNSEGYNNVGVGDLNWFNIFAKNIQKIQGAESGIGFTHFADLSRYGITSTGTTSVVAKGPTNSALQMSAGSEISFQSATLLVELWADITPSSGTLEFYYNDVLYRTIDFSTHGTLPAFSTFSDQLPIVVSPSTTLGTYKIKCVGASVTITALFQKILGSSPTDDITWFLRQGVSGQSFNSFNIPLIKETFGLGIEKSTLYLLNLGTNSIYNPSIAQTSTNYGISLRAYINGLRDTTSDHNKNIVYLMPPNAVNSVYPVVYEPYINYYNVAKAICEELSVMFIDLNDIYDRVNDISALYDSDGLHFNATGHSYIARKIKNVLAKKDVDSYNQLIDVVKKSATLTENVLPKVDASGKLINSNIYSDSIGKIGLNGTPNQAGGYGIQAFGGIGLKVTTGDDSANGGSGIWTTLNGGSTYEGFAWQLGASGDVILLQGNGSAFINRLTVNKTTGAVKISNLSGTGDRNVVAAADGTLKIGTVDSRPYKVYTALLTQGGANSPDAIVLENTLGGSIVWSYDNTGVFYGTLSNAFTLDKTAIFNNITNGNVQISAVRESVNQVLIQSRDIDTGANINGGIDLMTIEIRVYN